MKRLLTGGIAGVLLAAASVLTAPTAAAITVDKIIAYDCDLPMFGHETLNVEVSADIPATGTVGVPIQIGDMTLIVPIPHDVYDAFTPFGATQIDVDGHLTQIPNPSGPDMFVIIVIPVPPITPGSPGVITVSAPTNFTVHLTPLDAAGNPTILGTLEMPCTTTGDITLGTILVS